MKITIITAVYNSKSSIRDCINSVLAQDYDDIEYIVVDGGSTDGTIDIIKETGGDNIAYFISEKDQGLYDAMNKGIRAATGDYIGFLHSDDIFYDNNVISRVVAHIKETGCDFLYGDGIYTPENNPNTIIRNWISGPFHHWKPRVGWLPLHPTTYVKRETYLELGLYDTSFKIAGDTDLLIRYLIREDLNVSYMHSYVVRMRMGGMSTSVRKSIDKWKEDIRAFRKNGLSAFALTGKILSKFPQYLSNRSFYSYFEKKIEKNIKN